MSEELMPPPRALGTTFKRPTSLLVLGDPNGAHIVLDASQNAIQLWVGTTIVGEWRAPDNAFDVAFRLAVAGDTDARFIVRGDGALLWGPGNAGQDNNLYRDGSGAMQMDGSLNILTSLLVGSTTVLQGDVTVDSDLAVNGLVTADAVSITSALTLGSGADIESPVGVKAKLLTGWDQDISAGIAFPNSAAATTPTLACGVVLTVNRAVNFVEIRPDVWFRNTNFGAGVAGVAALYHNGVAEPIIMPSQTSAANARAQVGRDYQFTNLTPGVHSFDVYCNLSIIPGVTGYSVEANSTTVTGKVWE